MALAVCLLFDRRSERAVRALWDHLEDLGVPSMRSHTHGSHIPHLSYAVLRSWDTSAVKEALTALPGGSTVELTFDGVGLFRRGRLWLLAGITADVATRQQLVVDAVTATGADLHKHYVPGMWLAHCSLAPRVQLAQLPVAVSTVFDVLPLTATLDHAALVNSATGEVQPLPVLP